MTKVDEIPYDFVRKRLTIVVCRGSSDPAPDRDQGRIPTPCSNLPRCGATGQRVPLDEAERQRLYATTQEHGAQGFRVLGLATKPVAAKARYDRADEADMTFAGFLLFFDPLKEGIGESSAISRAAASR